MIKELHEMNMQELVKEMFEAHQHAIYEHLRAGFGPSDRLARIICELDGRFCAGANTVQFQDDLEVEQDNYRAIAKSRYEDMQKKLIQ